MGIVKRAWRVWRPSQETIDRRNRDEHHLRGGLVAIGAFAGMCAMWALFGCYQLAVYAGLLTGGDGGLVALVDGLLPLTAGVLGTAGFVYMAARFCREKMPVPRRKHGDLWVEVEPTHCEVSCSLCYPDMAK